MHSRDISWGDAGVQVTHCQVPPHSWQLMPGLAGSLLWRSAGGCQRDPPERENLFSHGANV